MEKHKRVEAINGEILLPEPIIQYIQSFLSGKEAAQTSVLSKSWYSAWLTRPNLDFAEGDIRTRRSWEVQREVQSECEFSKFVKKTMQRYDELNLNIESFKLWMCGSWMNYYDMYKSSLANDLIVKAIKRGATDLNFKLWWQRDNFVLPQEVLGSETLIRLSVSGCKIDLGVDRKVSCSQLKSLSLCNMLTEGYIIWDIVSSCPLIEKLVLSESKCLHKVDDYKTGTRMLVLDSLTRADNLYKFDKLKFLLLEKVELGPWFFRDFLSTFPCLKHLALHHCIGYREIKVESKSLEFISFTQARMLRAKFDVPRIRKFKFSGSCVPTLSFGKASREWASDISLTCTRNRYCLNTSWFVKFNEFLMELSPSRISLSLNMRISSEERADYAGEIQGLPKPLVEDLMISIDAPSLVCSWLLDCLFWSCCPKSITLIWLPKSPFREKTNTKFVKLLCMMLITESTDNCFIPNRTTASLHDIEEVTLEFFEENLAEWQPLPWKTLLNAPENSGNGIRQKIRFQLRWGVTFK